MEESKPGTTHGEIQEKADDKERANISNRVPGRIKQLHCGDK